MLENENRERHKQYLKLLDTQDVKDWLASCNPSVRDSNFRRLGLVCDELKTTPFVLSKMSEKEAFRFLLRLKEHYEQKGKAGSYISSLIKNTKSWFSFNDIEVKKDVPVKIIQKRERVITTAELRSVLAEAKLRAAVAVSLMAFSGIRPEVIGNYNGKDGLKLGDLPELRIEDGKASFPKIPAQVIVRMELSKTDHEYLTFLNERGCRAVSTYLQWRLDNKEKLNDSTPLITSDPQRADSYGGHVVTKSISALIRKPVRKAGLKMRPYVLRRYFSQRMAEAEAADMIIRDWKIFWMGHNNIELTYAFSKGELPSSTLEQMRAGYKAADEKFLSTETQMLTPKDIQAEIYQNILSTFSNLNADEIGKLELEKMKPEDIKKIVDSRYKTLTDEVAERLRKTGRIRINPDAKERYEYIVTIPQTQEVIPIEKLEEGLKKGYRLVSVLPDGKKAVVEIDRTGKT